MLILGTQYNSKHNTSTPQIKGTQTTGGENSTTTLDLYHLYRMANYAINSALYKWVHNSFVLRAMKLKFAPNYSVRSNVSNGVQHKAIGRSMGK